MKKALVYAPRQNPFHCKPRVDLNTGSLAALSTTEPRELIEQAELVDAC